MFPIRSSQNVDSGIAGPNTAGTENMSNKQAPIARTAPAPRAPWSKTTKALSALLGAMLAGGTAYAATNWAVGLTAASSANAQGAGIANLVISKIATGPTEANLLYPSATSASPGSGDVTFTLNNPNPYAVSVTGVTLTAEPITGATANDAQAYTTNSLGTAIPGCSTNTSTPNVASTVTWTGASTSTVQPELFTSGTRGGQTQVGAFAIAANATITVTLTADAAMDTAAPIACAGSGSGPTYTGAYFVMPPLSAISASAGAGALTPVANGGNVTTGW